MTLYEAHSLLLTKVEKKKTHHTIKTLAFFVLRFYEFEGNEWPFIFCQKWWERVCIK